MSEPEKQINPPITDGGQLPIHVISGLPGSTKILVNLAAFVIIVAGMKAAVTIIVPFLLALFIAIISGPLLFLLQKKGLSTGFSVLVVSLIILAVGLLLGGVLATSIPAFTSALPDYAQKIQENINILFSWIESKGLEIPEQSRSLLNYIKPDAAIKLMGDLLAQLGNLLTDGFLIFLILLFILLEASIFPQKIRAAMKRPEESFEDLATIASDVKKYLAIKTGVSLLTGVFIAVWLMVFKVNYPVIFGLIAFLLNFVPSIGSFIAAIPAIIIALIQPEDGGLTKCIFTAVGYLIVNFGIGNLLEPRLMGQRLGLSTLIVFMSLMFWGWVLGPMGMLLSVPLTMTAKIILQSNQDTRWISILLGSADPPNEKVECK